MNNENKLPEDFKKRWVEALRSGKYKQGYYTLFNDEMNNYCCLGVACVVAGYSDVQGKIISTERYPNVPSVLRGSSLSNSVVSLLTGMNDEGNNSFLEIADYIEANL